jgi:hypothetical protein
VFSPIPGCPFRAVRADRTGRGKDEQAGMGTVEIDVLVIVIIALLLLALVGCAWLMARLVGSIHAALLEAKTAEATSCRQIAEIAVTELERVANEARAARGEGPFEVIAAVIPEHQSPTTERQRITAEIATLRARLVAARRNLEPRAGGREDG